MTGSNALILPSQMLSTQDKYTDSLHLYIYRQLKAEKNKKYSCDIYANAEKSRTFANEKRNRGRWVIKVDELSKRGLVRDHDLHYIDV